DRRRTMIITDVSRALVLLPLLLVQDHTWLGLVYGVVFVQGAISQLFAPAQGALIPVVVGEEHLTAANAMNALGAQLMRLIGPLLGGVLFGILGLEAVIITDSLSYVFSGLMSLLVVLPPGAPRGSFPPRLPHRSTHSMFWQEWLEGLRFLHAERIILILFLISGTAMLGDGMIRAVGTPFLSQVAGGNAVLFSWIVAAQGTGAVIGSLVINHITKMLHPFKLLALAAAVTAMLGFIEVAFPILPVVITCAALMGAPIVFFFVNIYTALQQSISDQYRGRVLGTYATVNMLLYLGGMILSSLLTLQLSNRYVLLIGECFYFVAGIVAFLWLRRENQQGGTKTSARGQEESAKGRVNVSSDTCY
ncbi:MAG: MFS transporter, partial [Ktedonobacteraceae bacterium]|nr:MFS transporter [Ktedonobacteraceae bacterium]